MNIEWMLLAEGVTQDARGALTAVGLNQNVFAADEFPAHTKRAVVTRLSGLSEDTRLSFRYAVTTPSGRTLTAQGNDIELGKRRVASLPASLDLPGEFVVSVSEYGEHRIEFEATDHASGQTVVQYVPIYVVATGELAEAR
jgi:hypothetical protein